jgi:hypothetical protein
LVGLNHFTVPFGIRRVAFLPVEQKPACQPAATLIAQGRRNLPPDALPCGDAPTLVLPGCPPPTTIRWLTSACNESCKMSWMYFLERELACPNATVGPASAYTALCSLQKSRMGAIWLAAS